MKWALCWFWQELFTLFWFCFATKDNKYQSSLYFPGMWEGEWWKCSRGWWWILEVLFGKVYACAASLLWLSSVIQHSCMQHDCESWRFWNDRWCGRWITNCVEFSDYNTQEIFFSYFWKSLITKFLIVAFHYHLMQWGEQKCNFQPIERYWHALLALFSTLSTLENECQAYILKNWVRWTLALFGK